MKKVIVLLGAAALTAGLLWAKSDKDQILMKINGSPVYKSEFEYLYNKNAGQQVDHQSLDDYVEMFVNYKLKVADALANGYDTTATFKEELSKYRTELASPYMTDKEAESKLLDEMYSHYARMVNVSHIMLNNDESLGLPVIFNRADSIRNEILSGNLSWDDAVKQFSIDRGTNQNGGLMGWLVTGRFPDSFEDMAYVTPVGEISAPVNSGYGTHLIKVNAEKPNPGEVKARHILKLTARKSPEEAARAKEQIDSIYTILMGGADFAEVARAESDDPGSKANGGELDWFGAGMMVAPFDSAAFSMEEGVISRPVQTSYGWHIIEVTGHRPMKNREEMDVTLKGMLMNSEKGLIPRRSYVESMVKRYNSSLLNKNLDKIEEMIEANAGGYDSLMIATLKKMDLPVAQVKGKDIPLNTVMKHVPITSSKDPKNAKALITQAAKREMEAQTLELAKIDLAETNEEYRNLINEYTDGILLFDISQDKVWQKAADDRESLEKFFKAHKKEYSFDEPRFKSYIIFTNSDSLETEVKKYLATLKDSQINPRTFSKDLKDKFGKQVRAERVIAKKGENSITDYLAFGGPKPTDKQISWTNYFAFKGKIINEPEEADDVRGKVTADYQAELEKEWVKELRAKYPVTIDKKVLGTVKEITAP